MGEPAPIESYLSDLSTREAEMVDLLRTLVDQDTPTGASELVDRGMDLVEAACRARGAQVERIPGSGGAGDHLRARWKATSTDAPHALLLAHVDTVWPRGEVGRRPFADEGGVLTGPGVFDMKAGLVQALFAVDAFARGAAGGSCDVTLLVTSDEETGSATSRPLIERCATDADAVLVVEPAAGRSVKTARKGVGMYRLSVEGRAAHAGLEPERGASAVLELAHQIVRLHAMNDLERGTTVTVGLVEGGTGRNVVPPNASATIDLRVVTPGEAERLDDMIRSLRPVLDGTRLTVEGGINRPPMERSAAAGALYATLRALADAIGEPLDEALVGGGSDGNFTAAMGRPTLDGLGAVGAGAHALHERVERSSLAPRAALLAGLLHALGARAVSWPVGESAAEGGTSEGGAADGGSAGGGVAEH